MKQIVWLACLAAVLQFSGLLPFAGTDVSELTPVETLLVDVKNGQVVLDGGSCRGIGTDWDSALEDLEQGAEGVLFLGTAEQIVLSEAALLVLPEVIRSQRLRPAAVVCVCRGSMPSAQEVAAYLAARDVGTTIQKVQAAVVQESGIVLPVLEQTEGGLRLRGAETQ